MKLLDDQGREWTAHFSHRQPPEGLAAWIPRLGAVVGTTCRLHLATCCYGEVDAVCRPVGPCIADSWGGITWLHPRDSLCKATGRKLALARAMKAAKFSKDERTALWAAYASETGAWSAPKGAA